MARPSLSRRLADPLHALFADLAVRAWTDDFSALAASGGSPFTQRARADDPRRYWYWQHTMCDGVRKKTYLGTDTQETRAHVDALLAEKSARDDRRGLVDALLAAHLPGPDPLSGDILAALAEAGLFREGACALGAVAFQIYGPLLGLRLPAALSSTREPAQPRSISLRVGGAASDLLSVLRRVDSDFEAVPSPAGKRAWRYALRRDGTEVFSVGVVEAAGGPSCLDVLLGQETTSVALHGIGVPIRVPDPARTALFDLLSAQRRDASGVADSRKDLAQARALIAALSVARPGRMAEVWAESKARDPACGSLAARSLAVLPPQMAVPFADPELDAAVAVLRKQQAIRPGYSQPPAARGGTSGATRD